MSVNLAVVGRELLDRSPDAKVAWDSWRDRKQGRGEKRSLNLVQTISHEVIFKLDHQDVIDVANGTAHALGNLRRSVQTKESKDATCEFAFHHLFHGYVEKHGQLPKWEDYRTWLYGKGHEFFVDPMRTDMGWDHAAAKERERLDQGLEWRLGCFYLSALREVEAITRLRGVGLPVNYHVFVDTELKVDFWLGDFLFYLRVPNDFERRKKSPLDFFQAPFKIVCLAVDHQGQGKPWLVRDESIAGVRELFRGST